LLATQSIRVGANRKVLEHIKQTGDIFLAWRDRPWILEGASVRVSMVGFDNGKETRRFVDAQTVSQINADLSYSIDLTKAVPLKENTNISFIGTMKGGHFDISHSIAKTMLEADNENGRKNSDVVRLWVNGSDITGRIRDMWIIDFEPSMTEEEAALYKMPFEYVKSEIKPERIQNRRASYRERWWIHAEARPGLRAAWASLSRYIATPRVAKHRLFVFVPKGTIPDSRVVAITREDDYFFGLLHSRIHETWSLVTSPRHGVGNDPTYNAHSCFETFPFPYPPGQEDQADPQVHVIAEAARELVRLRDAWLAGDDQRPTTNDQRGSAQPSSLGDDQRPTTNDQRAQPSSFALRPSSLKDRTLTNLYNRRPDWLDLAHRRLDAAVFAAYGWPNDLSDDEILARLLALNLERAAGQAAVAGVVGDSDDQE
jgi:type II restriction/modification system DNA methylase subunit YeeA